MIRTLTTVGVCALAVGVVTGCGDDSGSNPAVETVARWTVTLEPGAGSDVTLFGDGAETTEQALGLAPDSITLEYGGIVVRSLRLDNATGAADTSITASDKDRDANDENIHFQGPYMCAVGSASNDLGIEAVTPGRYNRVVFVIEPATNRIVGHPEMDGQSIRIAGLVWRDGRSSRFTFSSDYSSEYVVYGSFELAAGSNSVGTLTATPAQWFRSGTMWLDPTVPGNRGTVLRNIRGNIRATLGVQSTDAL